METWGLEKGVGDGGLKEREQGEIPGFDYRVDMSSEGDGSQVLGCRWSKWVFHL